MNQQVTLLSTGDISKRFGLNISAPFIRQVLKVEHAEKVKAGFYWTEEGFKAICFSLATHIKNAHDGKFAPERVVTPRKKPEDAAPAANATGQAADDFDPFADDPEVAAPVDDSTDDLFN